jgi:hypothetical protein
VGATVSCAPLKLNKPAQRRRESARKPVLALHRLVSVKRCFGSVAQLEPKKKRLSDKDLAEIPLGLAHSFGADLADRRLFEPDYSSIM